MTCLACASSGPSITLTVGIGSGWEAGHAGLEQHAGALGGAGGVAGLEGRAEP